MLLSACSEGSAETTGSVSPEQQTDATAEETATEFLENAEQTEIARVAGAPLFEGMGDHHHPITTDQPLAQKYFDQGLIIDFAFNHAESVRSFKAAQSLDQSCAMCYWGEALALGPNINVTSNGKAIMFDDARVAAFAAVQQAVALKDHASELERAYIDALAVRYNGKPETPREPLDMAFADAMRELHHKYPEDDDAASLFAEALMTTMPWNYWLDPENPKPRTEEVIAALETVLARTPDHPLALHLYIHAPATWCICRHTFTGGSAVIMTLRRPMFAPPRSTRPISPSATRRGFIQLFITRITFIFCGRHPAWRAAARWRLKPRGEWRPMCAWK
jgi:hypothetical protein